MGKLGSQDKPRLTLGTIREIKQTCAQLARNEFIDGLVAQGEPITAAAALADEQAARFACRFFRVDEQVLTLFDIVKLESEMRATDVQIEEAVRAICGIYMREILKVTADRVDNGALV